MALEVIFADFLHQPTFFMLPLFLRFPQLYGFSVSSNFVLPNVFVRAHLPQELRRDLYRLVLSMETFLSRLKEWLELIFSEGLVFVFAGISRVGDEVVLHLLLEVGIEGLVHGCDLPLLALGGPFRKSGVKIFPTILVDSM